MGLRTKKIIGVNITISKHNCILEEIKKCLEKVKSQKSKVKSFKIKPLAIFTPNPEIVTYAQKNPIFKRVINSSQINIPDGTGICWAAKKIYQIKINRITGVDLMLDLSKMASEYAFTIGLIGGRKGLALTTLKCLQKEFANLKGWAMDGPEIGKSKIKNQERLKTTLGEVAPLGGDSPEVKKAGNNSFDLGISSAEMRRIINKIIKEQTDILFVGFGHPKQEYFISAISGQLSAVSYQKPLVLMAVGGSFDYLVGRVPRAPKFIQDRGLEWLFRLLIQPQRLPRQIKGAEFFYLVWREKM